MTLVDAVPAAENAAEVDQDHELPIVVISRIRVVSGNARDVARQYQRRAGVVDDVPGFLGLEVLQPQDEPEEFWIYTRWANLDAYEAYRKGPEFRKAHARLALIPGIVKIDKANHSVTKFHVLAR